MPDRLYNELQETLAASRSQFEYLRDIGLQEQPFDRALVQADIASSAAASPEGETLEQIRQEMGDCCRCELGQESTNLVFGVGNPNARLVFVGEAPGREEDAKGEPFVGEAGQLLDKILLAMGMQRSEVYICNVLKCRPPNNRDPLPEEVATCESFLMRQLAAIQPQFIVALGRFAVQTLLKNKAPISKLRGEWRSYQDIPLMPTFHPAYLLRNPQGKREVWEDMKEVRRRLLAEDPGAG